MAKMNCSCCGIAQRVSVFNLVSSKQAYEFQKLYHLIRCKFTGKTTMEWTGQYHNGNFTAFIRIPESEHQHWLRRVETSQAAPEPRIMSEFSKKAAMPADLAGYYHNTLEIAQYGRILHANNA